MSSYDQRLCDEKHKGIEDKVNYISGMMKSIFITLILEVVVLGFLAIKGCLING